MARAESEKAHEHAEQVKIANDAAAAAAKEEEQDAARAAAEREAERESLEIPTTSQLPPIFDTGEDDNDCSDGEGKDKESMASEVILRSEVSMDPATVEPEEEDSEPALEPSKKATQEAEEPLEGGTMMSIEEEGIVCTLQLEGD